MRWIKIFESFEKGKEIIEEGKSKLVIIGERKICLSNFRNSFKASENKCPHLGEELHKGKLNYLGEIICPWHSYRFNLTTGEESDRRCGDLMIYPTRADQEGVFIGIP